MHHPKEMQRKAQGEIDRAAHRVRRFVWSAYRYLHLQPGFIKELHQGILRGNSAKVEGTPG
jgi:hypothetical protein